jgi:hypothetical protein
VSKDGSQVIAEEIDLIVDSTKFAEGSSKEHYTL